MKQLDSGDRAVVDFDVRTAKFKLNGKQTFWGMTNI